MDLTDEALIESFRQTKDSTHFKSLVRRYQNRIYSAAYRILGNTQEAEEVVQETYIKIHHNLPKFRQQCTVGAWIFRIAHNLCVDLLRRKSRQPGMSFFPTDGSQALVSAECSPELISQVADSEPSPAMQMDINEQSQIIQESLGQLPESQRVVVVLHDMEGFEYKEIAEIVGANVGTVRSRLHYGRLKLRELLEPYFSNNTISPAPR